MTKVCFGFLQEHGSVFSGSYTSRSPVLRPTPETSHFNTGGCSTKGFKKKEASLLRAEYKLGESPGRDAEYPMKASNFGHISKGHPCGKVAEVMAVLTELPPTQLWPYC